jgi:hypothetical protein
LDSGRYGLIVKQSATTEWYCVSPTNIGSSSAVKLGTFMAGMLHLGLQGRGRLATPQGRDDWSFTIDELLHVTATRMFKHGLTLGSRRAPAGSHIPLIAFEVALPAGTTDAELAAHVESISNGLGDYIVGGDPTGGGGEGVPPAAAFDEGPSLSTVQIVTRQRGHSEAR